MRCAVDIKEAWHRYLDAFDVDAFDVDAFDVDGFEHGMSRRHMTEAF